MKKPTKRYWKYIIFFLVFIILIFGGIAFYMFRWDLFGYKELGWCYIKRGSVEKYFFEKDGELYASWIIEDSRYYQNNSYEEWTPHFVSTDGLNINVSNLYISNGGDRCLLHNKNNSYYIDGGTLSGYKLVEISD